MPEPVVNEMAAELAADLEEAAAEGVSGRRGARQRRVRPALIRRRLGSRTRRHPETTATECRDRASTQIPLGRWNRRVRVDPGGHRRRAGDIAALTALGVMLVFAFRSRPVPTAPQRRRGWPPPTARPSWSSSRATRCPSRRVRGPPRARRSTSPARASSRSGRARGHAQRLPAVAAGKRTDRPDHERVRHRPPRRRRELNGTSLDTLRAAPNVAPPSARRIFRPIAHDDPDLSLVNANEAGRGRRRGQRRRRREGRDHRQRHRHQRTRASTTPATRPRPSSATRRSPTTRSSSPRCSATTHKQDGFDAAAIERPRHARRRHRRLQRAHAGRHRRRRHPLRPVRRRARGAARQLQRLPGHDGDARAPRTSSTRSRRRTPTASTSRT